MFLVLGDITLMMLFRDGRLLLNGITLKKLRLSMKIKKKKQKKFVYQK